LFKYYIKSRRNDLFETKIEFKPQRKRKSEEKSSKKDPKFN